MSKVIRIALMVLMSGVLACAQTAEPKPQPSAPAQNAAGAAAQAPAPRPDAAQQMRVDLDQMESLLNNMATQTSFIRDTNMSILLNTNARLWSILIRDLRLQVDEQQRQAADKLNSPQRH
jgi:TolA-binding protein